MAEGQDQRRDQLGGYSWNPSECAQQPQLRGRGAKPTCSRGIGEVDWTRLGNEQDVGGKGERETMDDPWAPGYQQGGRSWSPLLR